MAKKKKSASAGKHAAPSGSNTNSLVNNDQSNQAGSSSAEEPTQSMKPVDPPSSAFGDIQPVDPSTSFQSEPKKKGKGLKIFGITLAVIATLLLIAYGAGCWVFSERFYPHTNIGNHDVSMKSIAESAPEFDAAAGDYALVVQGKGLSLTLKTQELSLSFDGTEIVESAHEQVTPWKWPLEIFETHDLSEYLVTSYDKKFVEEKIITSIDEYNAGAIPPQNAAAVFDAKTEKFTISPEKAGTTLDKEIILNKVDDAISTLTPQVSITSDDLEQPTVLSTSKELAAACKEADAMIKANISLTLNGTEIAALDPALESTWVNFGEDFSVTLNEEAFGAWTEGVVSGLNTVGTERTYTRPDGKVITVSGGTYGWEIDSDSLRSQIKEGMAAGTIGTIEIPILQSGSGFASLGGQDWGSRYMDVDLSEQHARFYNEAGTLIWESDFISGRPDGKHNTPTGVYMLNYKESPSKLVGEIDPKTKKPEYETKVTYWMPFVGNAVGFHDATWQPSFGGSMYADGYGSHGCVNLSYEAAETLYGLIEVGDPVISHW